MTITQALLLCGALVVVISASFAVSFWLETRRDRRKPVPSVSVTQNFAGPSTAAVAKALIDLRVAVAELDVALLEMQETLDNEPWWMEWQDHGGEAGGA